MLPESKAIALLLLLMFCLSPHVIIWNGYTSHPGFQRTIASTFAHRAVLTKLNTIFQWKIQYSPLVGHNNRHLHVAYLYHQYDAVLVESVDRQKNNPSDW